MKFLVILAVSVALCAGSAIPVIPGDNSHYVEGESRYIWMPDGDGVPHLVDLHEPIQHDPSRTGANNEYWLYTRSNPNTPQIIVHGNANSIAVSNYNPNHSLKVLSHGWNGNGNSGSNSDMRASFLETGDHNVIVIDWRTVANQNYISAASGVPDVGNFLGQFLVWLINTGGGNWNNVHLIGFSLGAHVVGNAGRTAFNLPARITGLDPAGPLWWGSENALRPSDGQYVETIHTDGGVLGIMYAIADVDFYPNGGRNPQPGCTINNCSHGRAVQFFSSSVRNDLFVGRRCVDIEEAESNTCTGSTHNMGNKDLIKTGNGLYALSTTSSWPFYITY